MNASRRIMTTAAITPPDGPEDLLAAPARAVCVALVLSGCALPGLTEVVICDAVEFGADSPVVVPDGGDDDSTVKVTDESSTSWDDDTGSITPVTVITIGETRSTVVGVGVTDSSIMGAVVNAELPAVRTVVISCCSASI